VAAALSVRLICAENIEVSFSDRYQEYLTTILALDQENKLAGCKPTDSFIRSKMQQHVSLVVCSKSIHSLSLCTAAAAVVPVPRYRRVQYCDS